jgi:hypothetical protein
MGRFSEEYEREVGESNFARLKLEELFPTAEDKRNLQTVIAALKQAEDEIQAQLKIQDMGEKGLEILIKIAKKVLL